MGGDYRCMRCILFVSFCVKIFGVLIFMLRSLRF